MRSDQYTVTASHDDLHRALARLIRDQQERRERGPAISRVARAVHYLEPALIGVAGALWVFNAAAMLR